MQSLTLKLTSYNFKSVIIGMMIIALILHIAPVMAFLQLIIVSDFFQFLPESINIKKVNALFFMPSLIGIVVLFLMGFVVTNRSFSYYLMSISRLFPYLWMFCFISLGAAFISSELFLVAGHENLKMLDREFADYMVKHIVYYNLSFLFLLSSLSWFIYKTR